MKIGIIREGKHPADSRTPLTPAQCALLQLVYPVKFAVQSSPKRCFSDTEYAKAGISVVDEVRDCDILLGVKEVPIPNLIPDKTYLFFSHTIKQQPYNRNLLRSVIEKNIRLIDYEVLTDERGNRLIAFGRWAGIVGAHNGMWTYAKRTGEFDLFRMKEVKDYAEAKTRYQSLLLPAIKIVLTGTGRVSNGAAEALTAMGVAQVTPADFLQHTYPHAVFTQLDSTHYVRHKDGVPFSKALFYSHPEQFESAFRPYTQVADLMINGIYWDRRAPQFFTQTDMQQPDFRIKVIADVSCDIAPHSSIPATLYATKIDNPVFGYNPHTGKPEMPFQEWVIDMMTIDNLPNELARDASTQFGEQFVNYIIPELWQMDNSPMIERATIAQHQRLMPRFCYLAAYVGEDLAACADQPPLSAAQ